MDLGPILAVRMPAKPFRRAGPDMGCPPLQPTLGFDLHPGDCLMLDAPPDRGRHTLLRAICGIRPVPGGTVLLRRSPDGLILDLCSLPDEMLFELRRTTIGLVGQQLRTVPRIATRDLVAQPLIALGSAPDEALHRVAQLFERLCISRKIWRHPPTTLSPTERRQVAIARGFVAPKALIVLDEPGTGLDRPTRHVVTEMILEARARGSAIIGNPGDPRIREAIASNALDPRRPATLVA